MIISHFPFSSARLYLSMIDDEPILNGASFEWLAGFTATEGVRSTSTRRD